ncbi:hypothetical protein ACLOJK_002894, partial [Asimina triloba]
MPSASGRGLFRSGPTRRNYRDAITEGRAARPTCFPVPTLILFLQNGSVAFSVIYGKTQFLLVTSKDPHPAIPRL